VTVVSDTRRKISIAKLIDNQSRDFSIVFNTKDSFARFRHLRLRKHFPQSECGRTALPAIRPDIFLEQIQAVNCGKPQINL
jgi:hypothetical protein